jgi:predicted RNA-binding protein with TRAM domain
MVEIPDRLECLFSASIDQRGDSYRIEIPRSEFEQGTITTDEPYRVAILPKTPQNGPTDTRQLDDSASPTDSMGDGSQTPPVAEGDVREVTVETMGNQGDGIAKIDRGYVVIIPGTRPDDEVTIEIEQARENVAFARVRDGETMSDESSDLDESFEGDTLGKTE